MPPAESADGDGIVGTGADLEPGTLLAAYRAGMFPMPIGQTTGWWSPDPRAIIPLDGLRVSRSLRRSLRGYEIRVDTAFTEVMAACGDPRRPHGWITDAFLTAYTRLHELGWAHSVEAWSPEDGALAGGLYGVATNGLFAGESMFHHRTDASKVALVSLVDVLGADGHPDRLLDIQWVTPHLRTLGAVEIAAADYQQRLQRALLVPPPDPFM
jgi:leucyl/phenylalanyl-tRNA--protein transferase